MARPGIQVVGARQLRTTLRKAGVDVRQLGEANARAGGIVAQRAGQTAPRRTGRLAGSVRAGGGTTRAVVRAGGAALPYGGPIHWGWPARKIKAQPFLVNAAHDTEPTWVALYFDTLERVIRSIEGA